MLTDTLVVLTVAFAACVQTTAGMGFALVLSPVLLALLAPKLAILLVTGLGLTLNVLVLMRPHGRPRVVWAEVRPMLLAAIPGSFCGLLVLDALTRPEIEAAVGVLVTSLALLRLTPPRNRGTAHPSVARLLVGLLAGALSTASGLNGPPLAMWFASRPIEFSAVRDSLAAMFLGTGLISAATLGPALGDAHLGWRLLAAAGLGLIVGRMLGGYVHVRMPAERLRSLLTLVILSSGLSAITLGLIALA